MEITNQLSTQLTAAIFNQSTVMITILTFLLILWVAILGFIGWFLWYYFWYYDTHVTIMERIGYTWRISHDRGRVKRKRESQDPMSLHLLFENRYLPPIDEKEYGLKKRTKAIILNKVGEDFTVAHVEFSKVASLDESGNPMVDKTGNPVYQEQSSINLGHEYMVRHLYATHVQNLTKRFNVPKFMEKYGVLLIHGGMFVIWAFIIIVTLKWNQDTMRDSFGVLTDLANKLTDAAKTFVTGGPPT